MDDDAREVIVALLSQLSELLAERPDDAVLGRLHPPAYLDDPDKDMEYQLLAGEELRSSHQTAIDTVIESLGRPILTEGEMWAWLRALNGVRLVAGTRLGIDDDDHERDIAQLASLPPEEQSLWAIYDWTTYLHHDLVEALSE